MEAGSYYAFGYLFYSNTLWCRLYDGNRTCSSLLYCEHHWTATIAYEVTLEALAVYITWTWPSGTVRTGRRAYMRKTRMLSLLSITLPLPSMIDVMYDGTTLFSPYFIAKHNREPASRVDWIHLLAASCFMWNSCCVFLSSTEVLSPMTW